MQARVKHNKLQIDLELYELVLHDILPETGINLEEFWDSFENILATFMPQNKALLETRNRLQAQIDDWHIQNQTFDLCAYKQFLKEIGYIVDEGPDFTITTENIDPEIKTIAGPQLVVPINNARFALNATNARWGSLFDAFYGTDIIPDKGVIAKSLAKHAAKNTANKKTFNPERGKEVIALGMAFLDSALPLSEGSHTMVSAYTLTETIINTKRVKVLQVYLDNGHITDLKNPEALVGYAERGNIFCLLFNNNNLHFEILIDPYSPIGKTSLAGLKDIIMEAAISTIQDCEDSVTAVDAGDKVIVYKNWLGLMKGDLVDKFEKNGKQLSRQLNPDREYISPEGKAFQLKGRSLMLIRHVGHLMTTNAILYNDEEIPEGIMDGIITALIFRHDYLGNGRYKNTSCNSMYIIKPKMHGPDEVRFTVDLFSAIEKMLDLAQNTLKIGIMDEERRTTVNLKECIRQAQQRLIFINTGFLDRTGDEIHTSMEAGVFLSKEEQKHQPWMLAYENWNVDIGLACGLQGKAQIGKGMWAMPDLMSDMLKQKIQQPLAGANCAWVPSPTAATLHAMHYHKVNIERIQKLLLKRQRANLDDILSIPLASTADYKKHKDIADCINKNAHSILGYVVRWIDQGIGCSKVPNTHHIELMEDRATLRISSQILVNWLHHGVCTKQDIVTSFKTMAVLVDEQNKNDPKYKPMTPDFNGLAFQASLDLVLKGRNQPNGYTEPLLHTYRIRKKH